MAYESISSDSALKAWLSESQNDSWLGLDTEFISEGRSTPELCLVQVAGPRGLALLDPFEIRDLSPFWERLCDPKTLVLVHACRSEMEFCWRAVGHLPNNVFDIQLAAGFVSAEYPAGFKQLGQRFLHENFAKQESRTRWNRRPLSRLQIEYALGDVRYLKDMESILRSQLKETGRLDWFRCEMTEFLANLETGFDHEPWLAFRGLKNLTVQELAVVRELWRWRQSHAEQTNSPPRRILRDDLIIELARRKSSDPARIDAVRGLGSLKRYYDELAAAIQKGLSCPDELMPHVAFEASLPQYPTLCHFLLTALTGFAKENHIAVNLLASTLDLREYLAAKLNELPQGAVPRLLRGWRLEMAGDFLDDLLSGRHALVISQQDSNLVVKSVSSKGFH